MSTLMPRLGFPRIVEPTLELRINDKDDLRDRNVGGVVAAGLGVGVFLLDCAIVCVALFTLVNW